MHETRHSQHAAEQELEEALKRVNQRYRGDLREFSVDAVHWQATGEAKPVPKATEKPTVRAAGG